ncbi:Prp18 domain-containing protein [Umbelopsis sp. PMI_123]|nr:Prp18 domain-containing protein [Umbelopsis sp. PMI_123]
MDFLQSALKDEIEKKRKALQTAKANDAAAANKKYISRAELERLREKEYLEEQERERKKKEEQLALKQKSRARELADQERKAASASDSEGQEEEGEEADTFNISQEEVQRRLRAKGQPIRLFAETDKQRKARLRTLELMEERSEGQRNDFMRTLEQMDEGMNLEALKRKAEGENQTEKPAKKSRDDAAIVPVNMDMLRTEPEKLYPLIYSYLKRMLREWEEAMDGRPEEVKRSGQGKRAAAMQKQTADYLRPLFKQLKSRAMEPDILARVTEITHNMQNRRYRDAQDSYLQLSIGNSPWPIGVTMVGIHERSAREKIFAAQVAHVLNDETTRKWIQSLKRLMTFAQSKYPPDSMSQMA